MLNYNCHCEPNTQYFNNRHEVYLHNVQQSNRSAIKWNVIFVRRLQNTSIDPHHSQTHTKSGNVDPNTFPRSEMQQNEVEIIALVRARRIIISDVFMPMEAGIKT